MRYHLTLNDFQAIVRVEYTLASIMPSLVKRGVLWRKGIMESEICSQHKLGVCENVEIESHLQPLDNERFDQRSAITSPEARLDMKAYGFWLRGTTAFFDVRVTHINFKM